MKFKEKPSGTMAILIFLNSHCKYPHFYHKKGKRNRIFSFFETCLSAMYNIDLNTGLPYVRLGVSTAVPTAVPIRALKEGTGGSSTAE